MNLIFLTGKICGMLMSAGSFMLLFMVSGLLFRGIVYAANAADAAIHHRPGKDIRLLLDSGFSDGISALHGTILPLTATVVISGVLVWLKPEKETVIPVFLICLWGTAAACNLNMRYHISFSAHGALFTKKFFASFVSLQDRAASLDNACISLPDGDIRKRGLSMSRKLSKGVPWSAAAGTFDNGEFCGKGLAICLKLYDDGMSGPDESVVQYIMGTLSETSAGIRSRITVLKSAGRMLLISIIVYSAACSYEMRTGMSSAATAVLLISGVLLAAASVLFRNACVSGRMK